MTWTWTPTAAWVGAIATFACLSYLWAENPVFRAAEHLFVGLATGFGVVGNWDQYIKPTIQTDILKDGKFIYIVPIVIGLLIYFQYFPKMSWLARYPMSFWVGYGVGYTLAFQPAVLMKQIVDSYGSKFAVSAKGGGIIFTQTLNNILFWVFLLTALSYFFFTVKRENKLLGWPAWFGRWVIMVGLGAAFGNTVMARISLFIGRLQFLFRDWLHIPGM